MNELVDKSAGSRWVFHYRLTDKPAFTIHKLPKGACGSDTLKVTCHSHSRCVLWVSKLVSGEERLKLLKDYFVWGAAGNRQNEQEHYSALREVKRSYDMKV